MTPRGCPWAGRHGGAGADPASVVPPGRVESELLHTYSRVDPFDVLILCVRVAVLTAVTLTVPIVLFPVRGPLGTQGCPHGQPPASAPSAARRN